MLGKLYHCRNHTANLFINFCISDFKCLWSWTLTTALQCLMYVWKDALKSLKIQWSKACEKKEGLVHTTIACDHSKCNVSFKHTQFLQEVVQPMIISVDAFQWHLRSETFKLESLCQHFDGILRLSSGWKRTTTRQALLSVHTIGGWSLERIYPPFLAPYITLWSRTSSPPSQFILSSVVLTYSLLDILTAWVWGWFFTAFILCSNCYAHSCLLLTYSHKTCNCRRQFTSTTMIVANHCSSSIYVRTSILEKLDTCVDGGKNCAAPQWHRQLKKEWWSKVVPYLLYASSCGSLDAVKHFIASGQEPSVRYNLE